MIDIRVVWENGNRTVFNWLIGLEGEVVITDIWERAKRVIGEVPHKSPLINRYEVQRDSKRKVVTRFEELSHGDSLILIHC